MPIALLSPRLSLLWFVPALANYSPLLDTGLELVVVAVICAPLFAERVSALARPTLGARAKRPSQVAAVGLRTLIGFRTLIGRRGPSVSPRAEMVAECDRRPDTSLAQR